MLLMLGENRICILEADAATSRRRLPAPPSPSSSSSSSSSSWRRRRCSQQQRAMGVNLGSGHNPTPWNTAEELGEIERRGWERWDFAGPSRSGIGFPRKLFSETSQRDTINWNVMILALAMHGDGDGALELFNLMQREELRPDYATFTALLSACSHSG
uniref:Pentatricopeptide repeat-containing protein n=1 Tax=Ananas comosus var. bracteatus TaxID=296719 RepID=A0A6V7QDR2_ANACO|nr:unnamed protein product [Ananas comosus var. bracteatus]